MPILAVAAVACSGLDPYLQPQPESSFATIVDQPYKLFASEYVDILSVDRQRVVRESHVESSGIDESKLPEDCSPKAIVLSPGIRKIETRACKSWFDLSRILEWGGAWHCGRAVLRLEAEAGTRYRVRGSVSKQGEYAELWIEYLNFGRIVAGKTRVDLED